MVLDGRDGKSLVCRSRKRRRYGAGSILKSALVMSQLDTFEVESFSRIDEGAWKVEKTRIPNLRILGAGSGEIRKGRGRAGRQVNETRRVLPRQSLTLHKQALIQIRHTIAWQKELALDCSKPKPENPVLPLQVWKYLAR